MRSTRAAVSAATGRTGAAPVRPAQAPKASRLRPATAGAAASGDGGSPRFRLPDGTRSVQSPWVWRGMFMMTLVALGFCVTLLSGGHMLFAALWGVITAGWFGISMWLWRQNVNYMR